MDNIETEASLDECNHVSDDEACGICLEPKSRNRKLFRVCCTCNGTSCLPCWSQLLKIRKPRSNHLLSIKCPYCRTIVKEIHLRRTPLWNSNAYCRVASEQYQLLTRFLYIDIQNYRDIAENAINLLKGSFNENRHFLISYTNWQNFNTGRPNDLDADVQSTWLETGDLDARTSFF